MNLTIKIFTSTLIWVGITGSLYAAEDVLESRVENSVDVSSTIQQSNLGSARDWHLTQEEWAKYIQLKTSYAGYTFPNLTPPELLGYFADTDAERNHYADIYVRLDHDKTEKELRFNQAYHLAALKLYGNTPIINAFDLAPYNPYKKAPQQISTLKPGDHLILVVDITAPYYISLINHAIKRVTAVNGATLDIFCANFKDDATIEKWAQQSSIPRTLVAKNKITINQFDDRVKTSIQTDTFPSVYLLREGKTVPVSMEEV